MSRIATHVAAVLALAALAQVSGLEVGQQLLPRV